MRILLTLLLIFPALSAKKKEIFFDANTSSDENLTIFTRECAEWNGATVLVFAGGDVVSVRVECVKN